MFRCICRKKISPIHEWITDCIKRTFETNSIRLICILHQEGRILNTYNREDITALEIDTLLQKIAAIKTQNMKLAQIQEEKCKSLHIQGKKTYISMYDLPDNTLLAFIIDCNPLTADLTHILQNPCIY